MIDDDETKNEDVDEVINQTYITMILGLGLGLSSRFCSSRNGLTMVYWELI